MSIEEVNETGKHTNLIKLDGVKVCFQIGQELLGGIAVWAVGFAEDGWEWIG